MLFFLKTEMLFCYKAILFVKIQPILQHIKYKNESHSDSHSSEIVTVNSQSLF
jgi:hypothetical protein